MKKRRFGKSCRQLWQCRRIAVGAKSGNKNAEEQELFRIFGSEGGSRSHDLRIMNPTL